MQSILKVFLRTLLVVGFSMSSTADDLENCRNSANTESRIAACSRVINAGSPAHRAPGILLPAYYGYRGLAYSEKAAKTSEKDWYNFAHSDFSEAIRRAEADGSLSTNSLSILYASRGNALSGIGERDRAISDYRKALQLDPSNQYAETFLYGELSKQRVDRYTILFRKCAAPERNLEACDAALELQRQYFPKQDAKVLLELRTEAEKAQRGRPSVKLSPFNSTTSPEFILFAMLIVGLVYVLGQKVRGRMGRETFGRQIAIGVSISVLTGIILKVLDLAGGEHLLTITIFGILVIAVSLFA